MKKIRILFVHGGLMLYGGTETFLMNVLRFIDHSRFEIDFIVHGDGQGVHDEEILSYNSKIFHVPVKSKDYFGNRKRIREVMADGNYDIVHAHLNAMNTSVLKEAKKQGINVRISHAHASEYYTENKIKMLINDYSKKRIDTVATDLFACSKVAGDFTYGKKDYDIWYNAIDLNKYFYDEKSRKEIRKKFDIEDKTVFGNIGRFNFQKNHLFLIDIFKELKQKIPNAVLLLVGEGEEASKVKEKVNELGLNDSVVFVGLIDYVDKMLSAFDHFLLPSLFEGLPYVLVEAQATGLQVFSADTVDLETKIIDDFHFIPIDSLDPWIESVVENQKYERNTRSKELIERGFELSSFIEKLENYYKSVL